MPDDKRQLKRWHLIYYLRVFADDTKAFVGHAVDISPGGLKLVSEWPIPVGRIFGMWMEIPREEGTPQRISFRGEALWSERDGNPRFYNTGFRLVDLNAEGTERIGELISGLKLDQ